MILEEFTSSQLSELQAFTKIEPWSEERQDLRFSMLCTLIASMFRGKNDEPIDPSIFMIVKPESEDVEVDEVVDKIRLFLGKDKGI